MAVGVVALAALAWGWGLSVRAEVDAKAEELGVRRMSREEAAGVVARDDLFGLPSTLPDAPKREIALALTTGTPDNPLPADEAGVAALFELYAVSVKGCRSKLPAPEKDAELLPVYVTVREIDGLGRVIGIDGLEEGVREAPFTHCLRGGVERAVFEPPPTGQLTVLHRLKLR